MKMETANSHTTVKTLHNNRETAMSQHTAEPSAKTLGRAVALCIVLIGALVVSLSFTA